MYTFEVTTHIDLQGDLHNVLLNPNPHILYYNCKLQFVQCESHVAPKNYSAQQFDLSFMQMILFMTTHW